MSTDTGLSSLANRQSFFGGSVGARQATALPSWSLDAPEEQASAKGPSSARPASVPRLALAKPKTVSTPAPVPVDPQKAKQTKLKTNRDFSHLNDSDRSQITAVHSTVYAANPLVAALQARKDAKPATPISGRSVSAAGRSATQPRPSSSVQAHSEPLRSAPAYPPAASRRPGIPGHRARSMTPTGPSTFSAPSAQPRPQTHAKQKIMASRGRKGAAMRGAAFTPQSVGAMNRKAAATLAMQQHIDSIKASRPTSPLSKPAQAPAVPSRHVDWRNSSAASPEPRAAHKRQPSEESMTDYESEGEGDEEDWRAALRSVTGYDASRFKGMDDDRNMEVSYQQMQAEERRSKRLGREEDARAEAEEAAHNANKAARKRQRIAN